MGLGKTLQTLAFLSELQKEEVKTSTSLVVCPATLLENWKREAEKFCPEFTIYIHHGSSRFQDASELDRFDLILTSYGTLTRDLELFMSIHFLCVIGDEAQHLKNRKTNNAKSMSSLSSKGRVLFIELPLKIVYPTLFPTRIPTTFKSDLVYHPHLEERSGAGMNKKILKESAPYLLRRKQVAPELPDKIEQILHIEMTEEQMEFYAEIRQSSESELNKIAKSGVSEAAMRMKTLTQLRLRQICCDPPLDQCQFPCRSICKNQCFS